MRFGGLATIGRKVEKPFFTLHIHAVGCRYEVRVNDIPADRHDAPSSLEADVPINPSVFTGENELAAVIFPGDRESDAFDPGARLELLLCVRELDTPPAEKRILGGIVFAAEELAREGGTGVEQSAAMPGPPPSIARIADGMLLVERTITLETPFPEWTWMRATRIPDTSGVRARVVQELQAFYRAVNTRDVKEVQRLLRRKAREMSRAFHTDEEGGYGLCDVFDHMADRETELLPFEDQGLEPEFLADGRMVRLLTPNGFGPVAFRMKDFPAAAYLNTTYCLDDHANWIQIR
jgi:hypothetical protein